MHTGVKGAPIPIAHRRCTLPQARKGRQVKVFHTMPEYEGWKESLGGSTKGWDIKYYKGLGTSTNDEAREYFANIDGNRKEFVWTGQHRFKPLFASRLHFM